ncbi:hypothetical protein PSN45_004439 [Yamadazyma tenuis]|uniref:RabGAP/TBC n=1 Tax=Candida tenuis (strain ATCC 10573 / BCRC 21748 / CBS 615 / JCM 9827 / NBRC 10315 / NRRL Y-1498 / VKM Y-70) TaxID=590646 RepID=G3B5R5_CANTC|nr:RabGAP/TBC [Yamadazyma tenuis ATCC 10573]EGV63289.1 RabGAP/TBC [Yamadazyma tenuis ATCC 10573]WEJ96894.1 hypothetical protein PSN45_004439 [Yamadazyma tenuis]
MSQLQENIIISKTLLTLDKYKSLDHLKRAVVDNEYIPSSSKFLRSLLWKTVYITESLNIQLWQNKLNDTRRVYHKLIQDDDMTIPWYKLEADNTYYNPVELGRNSSLRRKKKLNGASVKKSKLALVQVQTSDDPLGENSSESNFNHLEHDDDSELLRTIILDIDRLFPGEEYFNNRFYKQQIIEILYVWAKCNPRIGYKQGFHEILGLIYINFRKDSVSIPNTNTFCSEDIRILSLFDVKYLCHDLFTVFNKFMVNTSIISHFYENEYTLMNSIQSFNKSLMKVDQLIHYNLISKLKLESQLWCIRYFRLILSRELGNDLAVTNMLWDKLITIEGSRVPALLNFLIIVLLINVKSDLIVCDFSECLSLLLHYPIKFGTGKKSYVTFIHDIFTDANRLLSVKDNDLELYECGMKINAKLNPDLNISLSYNGRTSGESMRSRTSSPGTRPSDESNRGTMGSKDSKAEKMAFEKYRMEMRLKKKAQSLMRP